MTRVLGLLNQQKLIRGQTRNSGKALLGAMGKENKSQAPLLSPLVGGKVLPYRGLGQRGGLGGLPTPLMVLGAGIMHGNLLLLLESQKQRLVFGLSASCS